MKDLILTLLCMLVLLAAGCTNISHSGNLTAKGKIFKVGGEAYNLLYVNGLLSMNVVRENAESVVETTDDDGFTGGPTSEAKTVQTIRFRSGPIISGYLVELAEKSPDAAAAYVKQMPKMNTAAWDSKTAPAQGSQSKSSEKSASNNYIDYLKEKLKSLVGKDTGTKAKETIKGDGEYTELYKDNSIEAQAQLTAELLKYADDATMMPTSGETIKDCLVHYAGRLAQLKARGKDKATKITLNKATVKGGKLTYLMLRLRLDDGRYQDEECANCFDLEN